VVSLHPRPNLGGSSSRTPPRPSRSCAAGALWPARNGPR
jgi:hypothetical protein